SPRRPAVAPIAAANPMRLFTRMMRYARPIGIMIDVPGAWDPGRPIANRTEVIAARRAALDPARLGGWSGLALAAYRAAADIKPHLRLMLAPDQPAGP